MSSSSSSKVFAVCMKETKGLPKAVQSEVKVGPYGVEGDYHAGQFSERKGTEGEPNTRQVSVLAKEVIDGLNSDLNIEIPLGGLGENIVVAGLGDLSDLREGDVMVFSSGVKLKITAQIDPCKELSVYHDQVLKHSYRKRGVVAMVLQTGTLKAGDEVTILPEEKSSGAPV